MYIRSSLTYVCVIPVQSICPPSCLRSFAKGPSKRNASVEDEDNAIPDKVDPDKEIKVVQSQNQRLVFLQPEPDYWIVAVSGTARACRYIVNYLLLKTLPIMIGL